MRVVVGPAAAAVCLPKPGGEAAGEPESEQEAGGGRGRGRGAERGSEEPPHAAHGPDSTSQGSGVPKEDAWPRGLSISNMRAVNVFMVLTCSGDTFNYAGSAVSTIFL